MTFRDFDAALKEKVGGRPTFRLGGQTFTCRAKLPWRKFSSMVLQLQSGVREDGKDELAQTEDFFKMVLIPSDKARFLKLLNADSEDEGEDEEDEDAVAGNQQVGALLDWLMAYYIGGKSDEDKEKGDSEPSVPTSPVLDDGGFLPPPDISKPIVQATSAIPEGVEVQTVNLSEARA